MSLGGHVVDEHGNPIAGAVAELSHNRYEADDWLEHETELDLWKAGVKLISSP